MLKDRWVLGFTAGALALVVLAILTVSLAGGREPVDYPAENPVGVVQRYLLAIEAGRLETARQYLGREADERLLLLPAPPFQVDSDRIRRIVLISETVEVDTAVVVVEISTSYRSSGIDSDPARSRVTFELRLEDGAWKIYSPSYFPF